MPFAYNQILSLSIAWDTVVFKRTKLKAILCGGWHWPREFQSRGCMERNKELGNREHPEAWSLGPSIAWYKRQIKLPHLFLPHSARVLSFKKDILWPYHVGLGSPGRGSAGGANVLTLLCQVSDSQHSSSPYRVLVHTRKKDIFLFHVWLK
jgi:hypothetical protein